MSRRLARLALALAATAPATSCQSELPPQAQVILYVATDAPLPPAPGDVAGPSDPTPLFDLLRVEVTPPGAASPCDGCTREFAVDRTMVDQGRASFDVAPARNLPGYTARVRLTRGASALSGEPDPDATLDTTVALPPAGTGGITELTIVLHTDDVGHRVGAGAPVAPDAGRPPQGLVGSWPGAKPVGCAGPAMPGEVCIPGGAYWMGNPRVAAVRGGVDPNEISQGGSVERIVVLSPFFLSGTEVTVAAYRAAGVYDAADKDPGLDTADPTCTFALAPDPVQDPLPVNCVSWTAARRYCQKVGADLPTEAQFEYAESGLRATTYVWGDDPPSCDDAVWGLNGLTTGCGPLRTTPFAPGHGLRDRLDPPNGSGEVVDLAGNLGEWCLDLYAMDASSCWGTGVFHDPVCATPYEPGYRALRGGAWPLAAAGLWAAARYGILAGGAGMFDNANTIGFRCARPGR